MSLEPYQEYKNSGVEWLGKIPTSWSVVPLRHLALIETGTKDTVDSEPNGAYPFYVRSQTPLAIRTYTYDEEAILTPGDGDVGNIFHHVLGKFDVHQRVYVIRKFRNIVPRFLYYYFSNNFIKVVDYGGAKTTVASLRRPMFTTFPVALGSLKDQKSIADYLDRETSEIDAFIADQEQLIALLEERRTATITQAVTKGLNPDAPMKNSGLEWLGEIPEHWTVEKLSWLSQIGNGSTPATDNLDYWADGDIPWLNSSCVNLDEVVEPSKFVTTTAVKACHLPMVPAGSLLVGLTGQGKTRGMVTRLGINSTINQHIAYVTPSSALNASYAYWFLVGAYQQLRFISEGNGGTKGGLTCDQLGRLRIPRMSSDEQARISTYLDRETAEIDAAITDAREAIALSKERRAAVISAAVTGKIDVRGLATGPTPTQEQSVGVA